MRSNIPFFVLLFGLICSTLPAAVKIESQVVGPAPEPSLPSYRISDKGVHFAILTMKGSKSVVVIDGAEGPLFDELLDTHGNRSLTCANAVTFSRDGAHSAYLARAGNDYIVVLDGKELVRGTYTNLAVSYGELTFSLTGRHLYYIEHRMNGATSGEYRLVMDGKRGPASGHQTITPVFSPDDSRWAYVARKPNVAGEEYFAVVDGNEKPYLGHRLQFTGDNRLLCITAPTAGAGPTLLVDGKTAIKAASFGDKIWTAAKGPHYAVAAQGKAGEGNVLFFDGSPLSNAIAPTEVVFSPDGKRWMAVCRTAAGALFVVTDGKPGIEYRAVALPIFTPDSSKAIYQASAGSKNFLVVNGVESDGFEYISGQVAGLVLSQEGGHYAYATNDGMNRKFSMVIDGKTLPLGERHAVGDSVRMSRDGTRVLFATLPIGRNDNGGLVVDGQELTDVMPQEFLRTQSEWYSAAEFSPDGKHVVGRGAVKADTRRSGVLLDGKIASAPQNFIRRPVFTSDSQHVMWIAREFTPTVRPHYELYVDGKPSLTFAESFELIPWAWEMGTDGSVRFLAIEGEQVKRYQVTAGSETSVATMLTDYEAMQVAELAAAEKVKADALAAQAKAKADAEAARAKAKADADAAYAAKVKARADALAAKKKAQEDAAAARRLKQ